MNYLTCILSAFGIGTVKMLLEFLFPMISKIKILQGQLCCYIIRLVDFTMLVNFAVRIINRDH